VWLKIRKFATAPLFSLGEFSNRHTCAGNRFRQRALPRGNDWNSSERRQKMDDEPDHISTTKARAGTTPHMTRYVLGWGLGLVIVIFLILLFVWR
jgi:hypothetical protein